LKDSKIKTWPKVTVVIVNWNGEQFLERCLSALIVQTVMPIEIILVDNASSDNSLEIVRRFPLVRLIALDRNTGFAQGNNLAVKAASEDTELIALLNPDAFVDPHWLEALLAAAELNPGFDVFGSQLVNAGEQSLLDGAGDAYHISGLVWRIGHGSPIPDSAENGGEIFSPCAAAALYRRKAWQEVGGFDEDYFCYVEDVDLGFRLRLLGYRCLYVPQSVVLHVGSGTTGGQDSDFAMYHGHRNLVWTFVKNMPSILFWLLLPLHVMLNCVSIFWFALRGRGKIIWQAKRDAFLGLPNMMGKRHDIQKNRVAKIAQVWKLLDKRMIMRRFSK